MSVRSAVHASLPWC